VLDGVTSAIKQFSDVKHAFLRPLYLMQKNLQFLYSEANSLRDIDRKNSLTLLCRKLIFLTVCAFIYFARSLKAFVCKKWSSSIGPLCSCQKRLYSDRV